MLTTLLIHTNDETTDTGDQVVILIDCAFTSSCSLSRRLVSGFVCLTACQLQICLILTATHPVILVDCEKAVVGAAVYLVKAVATVVALVATSTPSRAGSVSTI
jgi:hypothetical protein